MPAGGDALIFPSDADRGLEARLPDDELFDGITSAKLAYSFWLPGGFNDSLLEAGVALSSSMLLLLDELFKY